MTAHWSAETMVRASSRNMFSCHKVAPSSCVKPALKAGHQKPRPSRDASQKIVISASLASQQREERRWTPSEASTWSASVRNTLILKEILLVTKELEPDI